MAKDKILTNKQKAFLDALFGEAEGDYRTAMNIAGYAETTAINEIVSALKDEIVERTKDVIALHGPKAAFTLGKGLTSVQNLSVMRAAEQILDRAGVVKPDKIEVDLGEGVGLFVLPPKAT